MVAHSVHVFEFVQKCILSGFTHHEFVVFCQIQEYLHQFIRLVIIEMQRFGKTRFQPRIGIYETVHLLSISRHNAYKSSTVVLQAFQQCFNGFASIRVIFPRTKGISLINEEHTPHSRINQLVCLDRCLSDKSCHQFTSVSLYQLSTRNYSKCLQHISHDARHGSFSRTRITRENIMTTLYRSHISALDL